MENYFTIKEFADIVGISTQAVYQRLDKDLKEYYTVLDGKKYLDKRVLTLFKDAIQKNEGEGNSEVSAFLKAENELLAKQIQEKDELLAKHKDDLQSTLQEVENLKQQLKDAKKENLIKDSKILELNETYNLLLEEKQSLQNTIDENSENLETLKRQENTINQLQENLTKALKSTSDLESQLLAERENISQRDNQILNKEKRLDEKESTIQQLLNQLQQAQEHSQYMSTQLAKANENLSEATFKAQELTQNQQILMKQQQDNQLLLTSSHNSKPSLIEKLFGSKNK
ncbi:MAG: hypothetical protein LIO71_07795 [Ruminococcus sp.]|nr:hypothetical protein [Ruminococcus sp.]MCD7800908.1 hypothetical protein [Ruminococcus sp.]